MSPMRRVWIVAAVGAGLAAAYLAGTLSRTPSESVVTSATERRETEPNLIVPVGLTLPAEALPPVPITNPTGVLLGEVKVPTDLLRPPPPATQPEFVMPNLK